MLYLAPTYPWNEPYIYYTTSLHLWTSWRIGRGKTPDILISFATVIRMQYGKGLQR